MILSLNKWRIITVTGLEELTKCIKRLSANEVNSVSTANSTGVRAVPMLLTANRVKPDVEEATTK